MDGPLIAGTGANGSGNIDVESELESIERFRELGMDVEGMDELLFSDIDEYKKRKMRLIREGIHGGYGDDSVSIEQEDEIDLLSIEEMEQDIGDLEVPATDDPDDELLLYTPSIDNEDLTVEKELDLVLDTSDDVGIEQTGPSMDTATKKIEEQTIKQESDIELEKELENSDTTSSIPGNRNRRNLILIGASLGIILLLVTAYTAYSFLDTENDDDGELVFEILVSDINPEAGNVVTLDVEPELEDTTFSWSIQPKDFVTESGEQGQRTMDIFFKKPGTYEIRLEASRGGEDVVKFTTVNVQERDISLSRERFSDSSSYKVEGHLEYNDLGDMKRSLQIGLDYRKMEADYWTTESSPMVTSIDGSPVVAMDGLGVEYFHLKRVTQQDLRLSGSVKTDPPFERIGSLTGSVSLTQTSFIDLFNKRPTSTMSDVSYQLDVQAVGGSTVTESNNEKIWTYPSLSTRYSDLRVEDISEERNITMGDSGSTSWGSYSLQWEAIEYDRIMDTPSLCLEMEPDEQTKQKLEITDISMKVWIGDGIPQIMKTVINVSSSGNHLDHSQTMIEHDTGEDPVIFGLMENHHESFNSISQIQSDLEDEFHTGWKYFPEYGSLFCSIPSDMDAQYAVSTFEESPNFKNFLRTRSDPFGLYSNFTVVIGKDQWKMSIGDAEEDRCWNQTVWREASPPGLTDNIQPVSVDRNDIPTILTYSGGETALKRLLSTVNPEGAKEIFGVSSVEETRVLDLERFSIGTKADLAYPMVGSIDPTLSETIAYGMFISSTDSDTEVGLDLSTGQLSYVRISG